MEDKTRNSKDLKKLKNLISQLDQLEPEQLLSFLRVKSRRNQDFMVDAVAHFSFYMDEEEDAQGTLLRFLYSKILKKQSTKIDRDITQLFKVIGTLQGQVGDYLALDNNRNAFRLLKSILYYSTKTLYRLDTYRNLLTTHQKSYSLLRVLIDQTSAPALREEIHLYLSDLVQNFYYIPYDLENNAFQLLEKTEKYGKNMLALLEQKVQEVKKPTTLTILDCLLFKKYVALPQEEEKAVELCKKNVYNTEFLDFVQSFSHTHSITPTLVRYYSRLLQGTTKPTYAKVYFSIAFYGGKKRDKGKISLLTNYLSRFYDQTFVDDLLTTGTKEGRELLQEVIETVDRAEWQNRVLTMRLMLSLSPQDQCNLEYWEKNLDERLIQLFTRDMYKIDPNQTESILDDFFIRSLEERLGHQAIVWTQNLLQKVSSQVDYGLSQRLRKKLAHTYDHRTQFSKTILQ